MATVSEKWRKLFTKIIQQGDVSGIPLIALSMIREYNCNPAVSTCSLKYPVLLQNNMGRDFTAQEYVATIEWLLRHDIHGFYIGTNFRTIDIFNLLSVNCSVSKITSLPIQPLYAGGKCAEPLIEVTFGKRYFS